jgi:two-component system cell cycle sensor histidine kinase/response regulator CckA
LGLFLATILGVGIIAIALLTRDAADPLMLAVLAGMAGIGAFSVISVAVGYLRFGAHDETDNIYYSCLQNIAAGIVITDTDGQVIYANPSYRNMAKSDPELPVPGIDQLFSQSPQAAQAIYKLMRAGRQREYLRDEFSAETPGHNHAQDREHSWYRVSVAPIPGNMTTGIHGPLIAWKILEITQQRSYQEDAFRKLQETIDYLDNAPAGFFSLNSENNVEYLNATLAQWVGIDLGESASGQMRLADFFSNADCELLERMAKNTADGRTETIDIDMVKSDGTTFPARLIHRLVSGADEAITGARTLVIKRSGIASARDAEVASVSSSRFFHAAPIGIATIDKENRIDTSNTAFTRIFTGTKYGIIPGKTVVTDLVDKESASGVINALHRARAGKASVAPVDVMLNMAEPRSGQFFISAAEHGSDEVAILYAIDNTEQKAMERQVNLSQRLQTTGQFAAKIAHDFNNLLTVIIQSCDALLEKQRQTDPSYKGIMDIKQTAKRAAALVRPMQAFSRKQTMRPEVLSLSDVIADQSSMLKSMLGERITLNIEHARDLWPVKVDENQFGQVIVNLASNARDAMPDGGEFNVRTSNISERDSHKIKYTEIPVGEYVLCEVGDTGCGMSEEVKNRIFELYFSTKEAGRGETHGGEGVGLSTAYGIIKQSGGFIFAESEVGAGTTFYIYLPRHDDDGMEVNGDRESNTPPLSSAKDANRPVRDLTGSATILLVEDQEALRRLASAYLSSRGYKIMEAENGAHALEVMAEADSEVDLVVSDVVMPEMDGPSMLREMRKTNKDLKIIFMSGYAEGAFKENLEEGEQFAFLPKPFEHKDLAGKIKEVLGG